LREERDAATEELAMLEGRVVVILEVGYATVMELEAEIGKQAVAAAEERSVLHLEYVKTKAELEAANAKLESSSNSNAAWFLDTPKGGGIERTARSFENPLTMGALDALDEESPTHSGESGAASPRTARSTMASPRTRATDATPRHRTASLLGGLTHEFDREDTISEVQKLQIELEGALRESDAAWISHQEEMSDLIDMCSLQSEALQREREGHATEMVSAKERIRALESKLNSFAKSFSATPRGESLASPRRLDTGFVLIKPGAVPRSKKIEECSVEDEV